MDRKHTCRACLGTNNNKYRYLHFSCGEHFAKHKTNTSMSVQWYYIWRPLRSSGQSSWLQIQRYWFDSWSYQIFWEVRGLEQGALSLVTTTEELLGRNSNCSGLENGEYGRGDLLRWPHVTLSLQKLPLTSLTRGGRSVSTVCSRTKATEFLLVSLQVRSTIVIQNLEHNTVIREPEKGFTKNKIKRK
jgi:hypothetical protein